MKKKYLSEYIAVYRFDNHAELLDLVKKSETNYTTFLNPSDEDFNNFPVQTGSKGWVDRSGIVGHEGFFHNDLVSFNLRSLHEKYPQDKECSALNDMFNFYNDAFADYLNNIKDLNILKPYISNFTYSADVSRTLKDDKPGWIDFNLSMLKHGMQNESPEYSKWERPIWNKYNRPKNYIGALTLNYHYDIGKPKDALGMQHAVTGNLYLNDDYTEGCIVFLFADNFKDFKNKENYKMIVYKPQAGDLVFYPAQDPCLHAVTPAFDSDRYLVSKIYSWNQLDSSLGNMEDYDVDSDEIAYNINQILNPDNIQYIEGKDIWD
jgi:hypothetical protein